MIDEAAVIKALKHVIEEAPDDYIYEDPEGMRAPSADCVYADSEGKPSCIVGHVFARIAPDLLSSVHDNEGQLVEEYAYVHDFFTEQAIARLRNVQAQQDEGVAWKDLLNEE